MFPFIFLKSENIIIIYSFLCLHMYTQSKDIYVYDVVEAEYKAKL